MAPTPTSTSTTISTFTPQPSPTPSTSPSPSPFTNLPLPLRLRIWRMTWSPRHVRLVHTIRRIRPTADGPAIHITTTAKATPHPPASLHVNQESRRATLRCYEIAFQPQGGFSHVYFNYELDILELPPVRSFGGSDDGNGNSIMRFRDFQRLRKVALHYGDIFGGQRHGDSGSRHGDSMMGNHSSTAASSITVGEEWFVPTRSAMTNPSLMTLLMPRLCEIWLGDKLVWSGSGAWPLLSVAY